MAAPCLSVSTIVLYLAIESYTAVVKSRGFDSENRFILRLCPRPVHYVIEFTCHGSETVLAGCAAILIEQLLCGVCLRVYFIEGIPSKDTSGPLNLEHMCKYFHLQVLILWHSHVQFFSSEEQRSL